MTSPVDLTVMWQTLVIGGIPETTKQAEGIRSSLPYQTGW